LKFYKDTLEETADEEKLNGTISPSKEVEGTAEAKEDDEKAKPSSPKDEKESETKEEEGPEEKRPPGAGTGPDGPPCVLVDPTRKRRAKRPIKWKPDTELTVIRYFELDENERVNVTKTFTEQKLMEHHAERNAFIMSRKLHSDDVMVEQTSWRPLIVVDNVPEINHGYKSREIQVQLEREKITLQDLFYHQSDSASEPDFEHFEPSDPIHIPIDDVTGNPDAVNNFRDIAWPAPKPEIATMSSSNAFGGLFNNLSATLTIPAAPIIANPPVVNPLASINLGAIASPWQHGIIPTVAAVPFLQTPPPMIQNNYQSNQPANFQNRNTFNGNNMDRNRGGGNAGGANWVRGNAQQQQMRRGTCFQFQKTGFCRKRNNGCPYIHER
jgi:protein phosphatase 1 regulatory subunit 10